MVNLTTDPWWALRRRRVIECLLGVWSVAGAQQAQSREFKYQRGGGGGISLECSVCYSPLHSCRTRWLWEGRIYPAESSIEDASSPTNAFKRIGRRRGRRITSRLVGGGGQFVFWKYWQFQPGVADNNSAEEGPDSKVDKQIGEQRATC